MTAPLTIDIPHKLGQAGARERLRSRAGDLVSQFPGGVADVTSSWPSENEMALEIKVMGQTIPARLEVLDSVVRVHVSLPAMLAYFSGMIGAAVRDQGTKLLS